jgi:hypothetical protein
MAKLKATKAKTVPPFLTQLKSTLVKSLKDAGIHATVRSEPVPHTRLVRLAIYAPQFKAMKHSERQDFVWRIVEQALPPEDQMRISMILTLTTDEATGK